MNKFRKKPVVVEAIQLTNDNLVFENLVEFCKPRKFYIKQHKDELYGIVETLEGDMKANLGDWVIKGVGGECYPCKPGIFNATYDKVKENKE